MSTVIIYFFFFVYNHTEIGEKIQKKIFPLSERTILNEEIVKYILSCSFCFPFWATTLTWPIYGWQFIFINPIVIHFVDKFYSKYLK